jgi:predicted methyltransferase
MTRLTQIFFLLLTVVFTAMPSAIADTVNTSLEQAINGRNAEDRARDEQRHPAHTLAFFQVAPGMTVAEALPGKGWYSNILANYLGAEGTLYGVNYPDKIWPMFSFATDDLVKERIALTKQFPKRIEEFTDSGINVRGFTFNTVPADVLETVDRVLMIRALHNLNRFEPTTGMLSQALAAVRAMLTSDGLVGVVQHRAPASADDAWADGSRGYLKQSQVIATFEQAGFELVSTSEINANPRDKPGPDDMVWRLPPSLGASKDDPTHEAAMKAIGESDRMTLLFRKTQP